MNTAMNAEAGVTEVRSIEGAGVDGEPMRVKPLIAGTAMSLLEIRCAAGSGSLLHAHDHESLVYVVSGRVKTAIGGESHTLGPGDACRHPAGVLHRVEALEDALLVEIKSPPPDLGDLFGC